MLLQWDPASIPGLLSGLLSFTLAAFVYLSRPKRLQNRYLAAFLFSTGLAWFLHKGMVPLFAEADAVHSALVAFLFIHWLAHLFHFLFVTTLDSVITRPLFRPSVHVLAAVLLGGAALSAPFMDTWTGPTVASHVYDGWWGTPGPLYLVTAPVFVVLFLYGFTAGLLAWRGSQDPTSRRQNGAYFLAFAVHDGGMALMLLSAGTLAPLIGAGAVEHLFHWVPPLVNIWMVLFLTYGILTTQLFDIDVKVRIAISGTTVAAMFAGAFLVVSETVEQLLPVDGTLYGVLAALGVAAALKPLRNIAEGFARRLLPLADDADVLAQRRAEVYRAALEGIVRDGQVTAKEREVLQRLQERLGLDPADAADLEATAAAP